MFGCLFFVFRSVASLVLGLVIFFAFLGYILGDTFRDNFLTSAFYTDSLSENDVYNRIYDEVLALDPEFKDTTDKLLGRIEFTGDDIDIIQKDIADVAREIIPPEYLQTQVEGAVHSTIDYLNKDTETAEIFIDLSVPLKRAKPALFRYIDRRIDELEDKPVSTFEELQAELETLFSTLEKGEIPSSVPKVVDRNALVNNYVDENIAQLEEVPALTRQDFREELENTYQDLAAGKIPARIPSIEAIPVETRLAAYDLVLEAVRSDPTFPQEAIQGLEEQEEAIKAQLIKGSIKGALEIASRPLTGPVVEFFVDDSYDRAFENLSDEGTIPQKALDGLDELSDGIKAHLGEGEIKEALKLGARGLAGPLIDEALDELRKELDEEERLDLVLKAAEQRHQTREEFLDDLDIVRDIIDRGDVGLLLALFLIVIGVLFMGAVHFPHLSSSLRWPGLTLFLSGLVFLIIGLVVKSKLFEDPLNRADVSPIPPTMVQIINDVLGAMVSNVGGGFVTTSIIIIVIGFVLLVASLVIRLLHIPFLSR